MSISAPRAAAVRRLRSETRLRAQLPIRTAGCAQRIKSRRTARGFPIYRTIGQAARRGQVLSLRTTGKQVIIGENTNFRLVCRGRIYASRAVCPLYRNIGAIATGGIYAAPTDDPQYCHCRKIAGGALPCPCALHYCPEICALICDSAFFSSRLTCA